jgi:CheY-like chemotaxis protein
MNESNSKKKILIVDDDTFLLDMYALKFSKAGYEVKVSNSGEGAMKIINEEKYVPDIILADVIMPGLDGLDMVEEIISKKLLPNVIVIMLTNQSTPDDLLRAKKISVDGYIVKATSIPSEVLSEVQKIVASKK